MDTIDFLYVFCIVVSLIVLVFNLSPGNEFLFTVIPSLACARLLEHQDAKELKKKIDSLNKD